MRVSSGPRKEANYLCEFAAGSSWPSGHGAKRRAISRPEFLSWRCGAVPLCTLRATSRRQDTTGRTTAIRHRSSNMPCASRARGCRCRPSVAKRRWTGCPRSDTRRRTATRTRRSDEWKVRARSPYGCRGKPPHQGKVTANGRKGRLSQAGEAAVEAGRRQPQMENARATAKDASLVLCSPLLLEWIANNKGRKEALGASGPVPHEQDQPVIRQQEPATGARLKRRESRQDTERDTSL